MSNKSDLQCNFCGKHRDNVDKLVAGPNVYICNECISISYKIIEQDYTKDNVESDDDNVSLPTPREIKEFLDEYIVGNHDVKEMLSVSAYNHYKRILLKEKNTIVDKSNVMLIGPTGCGKTLFAKTLAEKMSVPFAIADATTLTESGYVGEDVESVLERLLSVAEYDIHAAQRGIIYIDEIDKKAKRNSDSGNTSRDVSGEGVQQALLRLIEGTITKVKVSSSKKYQDEYIEFDTSNILFIVGGAFVGMEKVIEERFTKSSKIGFGAKVITENKRYDLIKDVVADDFVSYGLIPEFMGRLPIIGVLDKLDEFQMKTILTSVKNNVIDQSKILLSMDHLDLEFSDDFLTTCAELAIKRKMGARALKSIVDNCMINIMYRAPELHESGVRKIIFDKYPLSETLNPTLVFDDKECEDTQYTIFRGKYEKQTIQ